MLSRNNHQSLVSRIAIAAAGSAVLGLSPLLLPEVASAQSNTSFLVSQSYGLQATSAQSDTLYLNDDRVYSYDMVASEGATIDGLNIPPGSVIRGRYEPAEGGGLRYVVYGVVVDGQRYNISAVSPVLETQTDPRDTSIGAIAEDAGIGAAAGAVLGEVTGSIDAGEVIGGAAAGGAVGNLTADNVVVIEPDETITLYPR